MLSLRNFTCGRRQRNHRDMSPCEEGRRYPVFNKDTGAERGDSPALEIFKTHLDKVLCSLLQVTLLWQGGWTR